MRKDRLLLIFSIVCLALLLATPTIAQEAKKALNIGILYDLTGVWSSMGIDTQKTAKTGMEWINKKGGIKGHPIRSITYDGQSNATKAVLAAKKLIEVEKIHVLQGCNSTGIALAVGPVCETNKVPFLSNTASEVFENTLKPHWSFRITWKGWEQVDLGLGMVKRLDPKNQNISILYQGGAYGKSMYNMAKKYAPKRDLTIVAAEKYDPSGREFGAQISKLLAANPDVVILYSADFAGPLAIKQMREMGMNKPVVGLGSIMMKAVRKAFKDTFSIPPYVYATGTRPDVWRQLPKDSTDYKVIEEIATMYEKTYGEQYGGMHHLAINSLLLIKNACERALDKDPNLLDRDLQTIRTAIRDKLETTKNFPTGSGVFTMTLKDHCGIRPGSAFAPLHWEKGKIVYNPEFTDIIPIR